MSKNNIKIPDYGKLIDENTIKKISQVKYLSKTQYANLDIVETLKFYTNRYVKQLVHFRNIDEKTIIADIGTGFGWLPMAFAFSTDAKVIAVEPNKERLEAGREIATYLGIEKRIDWRVCGLGNLELNDNEVDVAYCIEVLEHVYKSNSALKDLCRISGDLLILTTPNLWFPVVAHDTQLPFCHWLPLKIRKFYARVFNRHNKENDNLFWSPWSLKINMREFKRISNWLHYSSYQNYLETFPFYLPYGTGRFIKKISKSKKLYYNFLSKIGSHSHYFCPSLAGVFKKTAY